MTTCSTCDAPMPSARLRYSTRCIDCARRNPAPATRYTEAMYGFKGNGTCVIKATPTNIAAHADNISIRG